MFLMLQESIIIFLFQLQINKQEQTHTGARGVMVIFVGIGHDDTSSNPGRD